MSLRERKARDAFGSRDSDLSRALHQSTELAEIASGKSDFLHGQPPSSNFMRSCAAAGLRGSIAAGLVLGCLAHIETEVTLTLWIRGIMIASVISIFSAWVDDRFSSEFTEFERQRERWEVENFPEGEIQEMLHIYTEYGLSETDALTVAKTLAKYPEFWVDHMLLHEIGIAPNKRETDDDGSIYTIMLPHLSFFVSFLVPSVLLVLRAGVFVAWISAFIQSVILFHMKRQQAQWLSVSSILGIMTAFALSSVATALLSRVFDLSS